MGGQIRVGADGSFVVNGVRPGITKIILPPFPAQKEFSLIRVEVDGVPHTQEFEIQPGQNPGPIRVILSQGSFVINGLIQVEGGELPADTRFHIVLRRAETQTLVGLPARSDSRGRFRIEGLPAGEYDVEVRSFVPNGASFPLSTRKTVTISGDINDFVITLDASKRKEGQE
jgi:hypothetical protein